MFIQIGDEAINPNHIVHVSFFGPETVRVTTLVNKVVFGGDDYRAFLDWWNRCAAVSKMKPANVRIEINGGAIEVTECPTWVNVEIIDLDQRETKGKRNVTTKAYASVNRAHPGGPRPA